MKYALDNFKFDFMICMDTDALVTGYSLIDSIDKYLGKDNPQIGIIGSYRIRADGEKRTRWKWVLYYLYIVYFRRLLSKKSYFWKVCLRKARKNEYEFGEHILGGAYIYSYKCIKSIIELYPYHLAVSDKLFLIKRGDDVIFSLLAFAANFKIGDFGRPDDPIAIAQNFLPISKEEVTKKNKRLIHSTKKGLNGESEEELRAYFRSFRK
jgi:hypothetical protein